MEDGDSSIDTGTDTDTGSEAPPSLSNFIERVSFQSWLSFWCTVCQVSTICFSITFITDVFCQGSPKTLMDTQRILPESHVRSQSWKNLWLLGTSIKASHCFKLDQNVHSSILSSYRPTNPACSSTYPSSYSSLEYYLGNLRECPVGRRTIPGDNTSA